jgi:S-adenosyl-L-methionine methyltransferase
VYSSIPEIGDSMADEKSVPEAIKEFFGLGAVPNDGADLSKVEKLAAAIDSSNYLNSRMVGCKRFASAHDLLEEAMKRRSIPEGLILEFGVYSGRTINHLASLTQQTIFGFDSFEGLPEDWRQTSRRKRSSGPICPR